ncbi:MAG: hypothetical protein H0U07_11275, partial [Actinobacteria bacterium]|nr:hypothetical protein [Actinomycetota bacterium]
MSEPLVSLEIGPGEPAERKGLRVLDDGRLEYRGDVEVDLDAHGQAELRSVPLQWRLQWTYTESELERVRGAIAAADDPPLRAEYGPDTRAIHPQEHVWRLRVGDRLREVTVHGWPGTRVEALEHLWRRLFELHQPPGETSVWRVWTDGGPVERLVDCEVGEVPVLAGVLRALFHPETIAPEGEGEPGAGGPPADVPLVEVAFLSERGGDRPPSGLQRWPSGRAARRSHRRPWTVATRAHAGDPQRAA